MNDMKKISENKMEEISGGFNLSQFLLGACEGAGVVSILATGGLAYVLWVAGNVCTIAFH
jgi:bacteriocin-like protein